MHDDIPHSMMSSCALAQLNQVTLNWIRFWIRSATTVKPV